LLHANFLKIVLKYSNEVHLLRYFTPLAKLEEQKTKSLKGLTKEQTRMLSSTLIGGRTVCRKTLTLPKDTLPKDILPKGRFAERNFAERNFAERTFYRTDSLPKIEISSERYRFAYTVRISVITVIVDFDDRNFDSV
jgi:hypothetical protein